MLCHARKQQAWIKISNHVHCLKYNILYALAAERSFIKPREVFHRAAILNFPQTFIQGAWPLGLALVLVPSPLRFEEKRGLLLLRLSDPSIPVLPPLLSRLIKAAPAMQETGSYSVTLVIWVSRLSGQSKQLTGDERAQRIGYGSPCPNSY